MIRSTTQVMTFAPIDGAVCILQPGQRPVRLSPTSVLELLDLFFREGAADLYTALQDAATELRETTQ